MILPLTSNSHSWLMYGIKAKKNSSSALQQNLFESLFGSRASLRKENITSQPCLSWRVVSQRIHNAGLRDCCWVIFTHSHVCGARNKRQRRTVTPSADAKSNSCCERLGVTDCSMVCTWELKWWKRRQKKTLFFLENRWKRMNYVCGVFLFLSSIIADRDATSLCRPPTASD